MQNPPDGTDPLAPLIPEQQSPGYSPRQDGLRPQYPPQEYPQPGYPPTSNAQSGYLPQNDGRSGYPLPPGYPQPDTPYGPPRRPAGAGLASAALVLGILSLLFAIFNICDLPFAIVGIVLGLFARRSPARRHFATIGLVLSVVGLAIALSILAYALVAGNYQPPAGG